jgi:hypothetical protein
MTNQATDPFLTDLTGATVRVTGSRAGRYEQVTDEWVVRKSWEDARRGGMSHQLIREKDGLHRCVTYYRSARFGGEYGFGDMQHNHGPARGGYKTFRENVTMELV